MKEIIKVLLQEGIDEEMVHKVLNLIEEEYDIVEGRKEGETSDQYKERLKKELTQKVPTFKAQRRHSEKEAKKAYKESDKLWKEADKLDDDAQALTPKIRELRRNARQFSPNDDNEYKQGMDFLQGKKDSIKAERDAKNEAGYKAGVKGAGHSYKANVLGTKVDVLTNGFEKRIENENKKK